MVTGLREENVIMAMKYILSGAVVLSGIMSAVSLPAHAQEDGDFYNGKNIRMIIGYGAGGGYDMYARLIAEYLTKYIPGHPQFIHENMPAAATVVAANWIYNIAPKDGTVIGLVSGNLPVSQLMDEPGLEFDVAKFNWIGNPELANRITFVMADTGIRTVDDLKANSESIYCGGPGVATQSILFPRMMNNLLGTNMNIIPGYPDGNAVTLAMETGEINCRAGNSWAGVKAATPQFESEKLVNILVQWGITDDQSVLNYMGEDVPLAIEFAENDLDKAAINMLLSSITVGRPFVAPPGVPEERIAILRHAFDQAMVDPEFLARAEALQLEINPMRGEDLQAYIEELVTYDDAVIARAQELTAE